jgi:hypothetical protein
MKWKVLYHPEVEGDLTSIGHGAAFEVRKSPVR